MESKTPDPSLLPDLSVTDLTRLREELRTSMARMRVELARVEAVIHAAETTDGILNARETNLPGSRRAQLGPASFGSASDGA